MTSERHIPDHNRFTRDATTALNRAAARARRCAIATNTGIVVYKDGKRVRISAAELCAEQAQAGTAARDFLVESVDEHRQRVDPKCT